MKKRQYSSLHEWLDRTGTPQYVLAEKAGLTQGALSSLLRGSRRCSLMKAVKLEEITGVPVKNLVEWPKFKKPNSSNEAA